MFYHNLACIEWPKLNEGYSRVGGLKCSGRDERREAAMRGARGPIAEQGRHCLMFATIKSTLRGL